MFACKLINQISVKSNAGLFTRNRAPSPDGNLYGSHPYYTVLENDGNAHSVLFLNSNAGDATLTPKPGVVYRTIGGSML